MIERFNRTLLNILSINASQNPEDWDEVLPKLMCAYRTSVHESTKQTPFSLIFGREIRLPIDVMFGLPPTTSSSPVCKLLYVADLWRHLEASYALVRKNLVVAHERQKTIYDQKRGGKYFQAEDLVWLHMPYVPKGQSKKLYNPWQGPFRIVKVLLDLVYRVERSKPHTGKKQCFVVHFDRLKPYKGSNTETTIDIPQPSLSSSSTPSNGSDVQPSTVDDVWNDEYVIIESVTSQPNQLRRSSRISHPPDSYGNFVSYWTQSFPRRRDSVMNIEWIMNKLVSLYCIIVR